MSYRFFYHFNKLLTRKTGEVHWSIHFRKVCYSAKHIECLVPTQTKTNRTQPVGVVQGFCKEIIFTDDDTAIIK